VASAILYAFVALAAPAGGEDPLLWRVEVFPQTLLLGDVAIVRVTASNRGDEPVPLPTRYHSELAHLTFEISNVHSPYHYVWRGRGHGTGDVPVVPLGPGDERVVAFETVEVPPAGEMERDFWTGTTENPADRDGFVLTTKAWHPAVAARSQGTLFRCLGPRPEAEVAALCEVHRQAPPEPFGGSVDTVAPVHFGLWSYPVHMATPEVLAGLEAKLSPGTLRDVLRATRLVQLVAVTDERVHLDDPAERRARSGELIALLDSCDPLERDWLGQRMLRWFRSRHAPVDEIELALCQAVAVRLSEGGVEELSRDLGGIEVFWHALQGKR